jgi:hypothetical protein
MCGKQRGYKSFVFVSAATKGVTGENFVSAARKGLSANTKREIQKSRRKADHRVSREAAESAEAVG